MDDLETTPAPPATRAFVVIPVHNRRDVTIRCLARLKANGVLEWARVIVVDDGSTDGTAEAVRERFPAVAILPGDGGLWWGGGIRLGMEQACREGAQCIVWLNDDCLPRPDTIRLLVEHSARTGGIAAGWASNPNGSHYGGFHRTSRGLRNAPIPAPGEILPCDASAGNCVAIARAVVEAIGLPDADSLPHASLDADYTLDATRRGFALDLLGSASCENEENTQAASSSWLWSDASPWRQWKIFRGPRSSYNYQAWWHLTRKHWGWRGIVLYAKPYLRLAVICVVRSLVPLGVVRKLRAQRNLS